MSAEKKPTSTWSKQSLIQRAAQAMNRDAEEVNAEKNILRNQSPIEPAAQAMSKESK